MLNDMKIRGIKPNGKRQKFSDGLGLYLEVTPTGAKIWRLGRRIDGKQKTFTLGKYPAMSLVKAREARDRALEDIAHGVDPNGSHVSEKETEAVMTFAAVEKKWFAAYADKWSKPYADRVNSRMARYMITKLGALPIDKVTGAGILEAARAAEEAGHSYTAHRLIGLVQQMYDFAIACGYCGSNVAARISRGLKPHAGEHFAALTKPEEIADYFRRVERYDGFPPTVYALKLLPYVFLRNSELRCSKWEDIDMDEKLWLIPAGRTKKRRDHLVPLSRQVIAMLDELRQITGDGALMFPGLRTKSIPLTAETLLGALRNMGYARGELTIHGFRATASTILYMLKFPKDVVELQLAHVEENKVRAAYNRYEYLDERREMMQSYADWLDDVRAKYGE